MAHLKIGSLFTGYGGLDQAVETLTLGDLTFVSDIEPAVKRYLEVRHPNTPNIGDMTAVDWYAQPHVDILTGGYPCQPFSVAGQKKGTDDSRHLWPYVLKAVQAHRPREVFFENVRGHLTLGFDIVLTDLVGAGYKVAWSIVSASSVGAPHYRDRLYIYGRYVGTSGASLDLSDLPRTARGGYHMPTAGIADSFGVRVGVRVDLSDRTNHRGLPKLLPTPLARDFKGRVGPNRNSKGLGDIPTLIGSEDVVDRWGPYGEAVHHWVSITGNEVPEPTQLNRLGNPQLTAEFPEWMMGLKPGRLTGDDLGLSRSAAIKMAGNGVVPQAATYAFAGLIDRMNTQ